MRNLTASMQTAVAGSVIRTCLLAKLEFTSTDVYLTSLARNVSWSSQTWLGNGWLRPFSAIGENVDLRASGCSIALGGLDATTISLILNSSKQGKKGYLYLGLLDSSYALISDPQLIFLGRFDSADIVDSGTDASVRLNYESELIRLQRINEYRYTDASQQALYPGDLGFQYSAQAADWSGFWGKAARPKFIRRRKTGRS